MPDSPEPSARGGWIVPCVGLLICLAVFGLATITTIGSRANATFTCVGNSLAASGGGSGGWHSGPGRADKAIAGAFDDGRAHAPAPTPAASAVPIPEGSRGGAKHIGQSGLLTAGSFDDTRHPHTFRSFINRVDQQAALAGVPSKFLGPPVVITVRDGKGRPVSDARISFSTRHGAGALISRTDGRAVLMPGWDRFGDQDMSITVTAADGSSGVTHTLAQGATRIEVTLPDAEARLPRHLDLVLVLDTTGSMGDELEYLKAEIKGITEAVHSRFPQVKQRYALVLYRDEGDEYVTRVFEFTSSIDEFHRNLAAQSAGGGGDTPEAVHRGLEEAVKLQWRTADTARMVFHIADAPPHAPDMKRTLAAINDLRHKGIAVYPIACSGYDQACEFVMRSAAVLTGGQFLFLTDDSGVGQAHTEPRLPFYQVERLNRLMVRMIAGELAGQRIDPVPADILRTVGRSPLAAGACQEN